MKKGGVAGDEEAESSNKQSGTRITKIKRWGCEAMIKFMFHEKLYKIEQFREGHNHPATPVKNREFEKLADNINHLNEYHKQLIIQNSRLNVRTSLIYNLCKEQVGFENVGASLMQFKNFQRNVKCLLNGKDGHMFISRLETLRETKGFVFAYETDANNALTRIFWTNVDSISCYALFGDAMSFDPTYGTNKYNMKFAPFTGIDNHKKSITFGYALLDNEDDDSFIWAFQQFLKVIAGKEPNYIISDQDAGIINAVQGVFGISYFCEIGYLFGESRNIIR
ncbi:protein FAR1-RELATED SEQUENCE 5-like [Silene latifolia]|uniref:protein FAR1-RELATED SEQUENCE 5-like n=1 Tax=Silene latifolia TaxID=37657 RepID=UPI003D77C9B9